MSKIEISRNDDRADWFNDAHRLLAHFGFVAYRNGFMQHIPSGIYAVVDNDANMVGARFVGLYNMRLNDAGQEMMHSIALVPWYGDGAARIPAFQLLTALLNQAIYGSD